MTSLLLRGGPPEPSWNFWLEEMLRRGTSSSNGSSHLSLCLCSPTGSAVPCDTGQSVLGRFQEICSSPLKVCMYNEDFVLVLHMPMLQSQAETTTVKVPWWEEFKCLLVTGLNLVFHVLKWSSSYLETLGAQLWRRLCSARRFIVSKNTALFQTFLYKQGGTSWVSLLSPTPSRSSER